MMDDNNPQRHNIISQFVGAANMVMHSAAAAMADLQTITTNVNMKFSLVAQMGHSQRHTRYGTRNMHAIKIKAESVSRLNTFHVQYRHICDWIISKHNCPTEMDVVNLPSNVHKSLGIFFHY